MGIFAPVAGYLGALLGTRRAMTIALALIGAFGVLRAVMPEHLARPPAHVPRRDGDGARERPRAARRPRDRARPPGDGHRRVHDGIQIGSTLAAALAVPLAAVLGGWRGALIALSVSACVVTIAWVVLERDGEAHERPSRLMPRLPWRSRTAWLLVGIFGSMASAYYGLNAWLPDAYGERGWSDESAGILLAAMNLTAIPASFLVPWLSDRHGGRRPWLTVMSLCFVTGGVGLVALPGGGVPLGAPRRDLAGRDVRARDDAPARPRAAAGPGRGARRADARRRLHDRAVSPFVLGGVRDVTGSFDAVLWACAWLPRAARRAACSSCRGARRRPGRAHRRRGRERDRWP